MLNARILSILGLGLLMTSQALAGNIYAAGSELNSDEQAWLAAEGNTVTLGSTDLTGADFSHSAYTGIWLGWATSYDGLAGEKGDLLDFVAKGGNLFFETGGTNWADLGFTDVHDTFGSSNSVRILAGGSTVFAGLTSDDMSNWDTSDHDTYSLDAGSSFQGLSDDYSGNWTTVMATYGLGHIVLTGQDPSFHMKYGSGDSGAGSTKVRFVDNALNLNPVPEPTSMAAIGLGALGILKRRKKA